MLDMITPICDKTVTNVHSKKSYQLSESEVEEVQNGVLHSLTNVADSDRIRLDDIFVGRSIGAKAKNYDILDIDTGKFYKFAEGSKLQDVEVFAGKGTKKEYRSAYKYANKYGGDVSDWQHVKGHGVISTDDGDRKAEVHWS